MKKERVLKRAASYAATTLIILAALFIIIYFSVKYKLLEFPDFITAIFTKPETTETGISGESDKLYEILKNPGDYGEEISFSSLTLDNARLLLSGISEPASFYRKSTVKLFDSSDESVTSASSTYHIYKDGDNVRIEADRNGKKHKTVIHSDGKTLVRVAETGRSVLYKNDDAFSYQTETGICDISYFFLTGDSALNEIRLYSDEYGSSLFISFSYEPLGQTEEYLISLDYGIVLNADMYENGKLVYSMTTESFVSNQAMSPALFSIDA